MNRVYARVACLGASLEDYPLFFLFSFSFLVSGKYLSIGRASANVHIHQYGESSVGVHKDTRVHTVYEEYYRRNRHDRLLISSTGRSVSARYFGHRFDFVTAVKTRPFVSP